MFDSLLLKKFNRIRARNLGYESPLTGWDAFVDSSEYEDRTFRDGEELNKVVEASYVDFMGGPRTVAAMGRFARRFPRTGTRILSLLTPHLFRWLVGPMERTGPDRMRITNCTFLTSTSPGMCHRLCKVPTEKYFTEKVFIPLTLVPDVKAATCEVTFTPYTPPERRAPEA
ncbi:beta-carotene isomerase domain-containing protein [Streptomyces tsukubensis]